MTRLAASLVLLIMALVPLVSAIPSSLPFSGARSHHLHGRGEVASNASTHLLQKRFNFGSTKVRGVNIGGWLVSEPWITPSLYENTGDTRVVDEYTFGKYVSNACSRLASHWASWITEDDFADIADAGLNTVRIPIGYWAFDKDHEPYCQGAQFDYLTKAVRWAKKYGLQVVIDLHGAPSSQNGFDNSGHRRKAPGWFNSKSYSRRAREAIDTMAKRFSQPAYSDTVSSIELLNEPLTTTGIPGAVDFLLDYYYKTYPTVRYAQGNSNPTEQAVMISDGFQDVSFWKNQLQPPTYQNVVLDHHQYSIFNTWEIAYTHSQRLQSYCDYRSKLADIQQNLWTIVGEWTSAPTDCAKWLNGRGRGSRYDGTFPGSTKKGNCGSKTGSGSNFSDFYKQQLKDLFDTQRDVYDTGSGWIYWTWKAENAAEWSYQAGLKYGWITKNLNNKGSVKC